MSPFLPSPGVVGARTPTPEGDATREPGREAHSPMHNQHPEQWVTHGQPVRAFSANDRSDTYGWGTVFAYAPFPTVTLRRPDGTTFDWAAHLCEPVESIPADAPAGPSTVDRDSLLALAERWQRMADEFDGDNWVPLSVRDIKDEQDRDRAVASWRESTRAQTFAMRDCAKQLRSLLAGEPQ